MLQTALLDVAIGLVFIFLLTSLLCSLIQESCASALARRQKILSEALDRLLAGQTIPDVNQGKTTISEKLKAHPLVKNMSRKDTTAPSYLAGSHFALALVDILENSVHVGASSGGSFRSILEGLPNGELKTTLSSLLKDTTDDIGEIKKRIEGWYDDFMERVSGWYKREVRKTIFVIGLFVASALNVDSLTIGRTLWNEPALRSAMVRQAQSFKEDDLKKSSEADILKKLKAPELPMGWPDREFPGWSQEWNLASFFLVKLLGILITAVAVCVGAQFWFDSLKRLLNLRAAGARPERQSVPQATASSANGNRSAGDSRTLVVKEGPQNAFESTMLSKDDVRDLQLALGLRGDQVNGHLDFTTRNLIRAFQQRAGRTQDGVLTPFLVDRIFTCP